MDLSRISLRERERGFLCGGAGTGKSTLEEALLVDFVRRYSGRAGRVLILDSKPRFRAEYEVGGWSARRRYARWDHGPTVPGSAVAVEPEDLAVAWSTGHRIVIAQAATSRDVPRLVACASAFLEDSRAGRPQLLVVDESMDFYRSNGSPVGGSDALMRSARAGRERGLGCLFASQRTRGIPAQLMEEMTRLYLFRLDYTADAKRLLEMGAPPAITSDMPSEVGDFLYWTKADYRRLWGPYRLDLGPPRGRPVRPPRRVVRSR